MSRNIQFFGANQAAAGSSEWFTWDGGRGNFQAKGTATSIKLEKKMADGSTPVEVGTDTSLTTLPNHGNFDVEPCQLRATIAGATVSGANAWAIKIGEV